MNKEKKLIQNLDRKYSNREESQQMNEKTINMNKKVSTMFF